MRSSRERLISRMLPVSRSKIAPDMSHEVIQQRMAGTLGMSSHTRQRSSVHSACHCLQFQKRDTQHSAVGGLLPRCHHCTQHETHDICSHCVPPMPTDLDNTCTCGSIWQSGDPVTEGWVAYAGVSWSGLDLSRGSTCTTALALTGKAQRHVADTWSPLHGRHQAQALTCLLLTPVCCLQVL